MSSSSSRLGTGASPSAPELSSARRDRTSGRPGRFEARRSVISRASPTRPWATSRSTIVSLKNGSSAGGGFEERGTPGNGPPGVVRCFEVRRRGAFAEGTV